tara:strand:- start:409 stop:927 length:519 start_codon:yes stop_codon:yes gene_type:complete
MEENFNINIVDNFLDKNTFTELYNKIPYKMYEASTNYLKDSEIPHVWYSAQIEPQVAQYVEERCEKAFNKKLDLNFCSYTMLATVDPVVHCDYDEEKTSHQVIVYIRGNTDLHKGTGFYVKHNDKHELNTHIGFKENRAIFWDSHTYHSPLNFSANDKSKRFSIIAQYKETT